MLAAGIIAMQTAEIRKLPLSMAVKVGFLIFAAALLIFCWYMVEVTWTSFGAAIAFAAVLTGIFLFRRDKLMSEATQKIVWHRLEHGGKPLTVEMAGTPKYDRPSGVRRYVDLLVAFAVTAIAALWPEARDFILAQGWLLLGMSLYLAFGAVYSLLLAPKDAVQIGSETRHVQ